MMDGDKSAIDDQNLRCNLDATEAENKDLAVARYVMDDNHQSVSLV